MRNLSSQAEREEALRSVMMIRVQPAEIKARAMALPMPGWSVWPRSRRASHGREGRWQM